MAPPLDGAPGHMPPLLAVLAQAEGDLQLVCVCAARAPGARGSSPGDLDEQLGGPPKIDFSQAQLSSMIDAAEALQTQHWPRAEGQYRRAVVQPLRMARQAPCCYMLLQDGACIGHARIAETYDGGGMHQASCAVTNVIVDQALRGRGLGGKLMELVEREAAHMKYNYLFLWTKTATGFYERCGFAACQKVQVFRPVFKNVGEEGISALESLFAGMSKKAAENMALRDVSKAKGDAPPGPDASAQPEPGAPVFSSSAEPGDTWMKKRLREEAADEPEYTYGERLEEVRANLRDAAGTAAAPGEGGLWRYLLLDVPWHKQVGPSCGLAAVRMVRDACLAWHHPGEERNFASLLGEAIDRGMSTDGELYNLEDVQVLCRDVCGLQGSVLGTEEVTASDFVSFLRQRQPVLIPYDSERQTRMPKEAQGLNTHAGIVVGACWRGPAEPAQGGTASCGQELRLKPAGPDDAVPKDEAMLYLVVQQSSSRKLPVAPLRSWRASNVQLADAGGGPEDLKASTLGGKLLRFKGIS